MNEKSESKGENKNNIFITCNLQINKKHRWTFGVLPNDEHTVWYSTDIRMSSDLNQGGRISKKFNIYVQEMLYNNRYLCLRRYNN